MGDALPAVDLGTGVSLCGIFLLTCMHALHACERVCVQCACASVQLGTGKEKATPLGAFMKGGAVRLGPKTVRAPAHRKWLCAMVCVNQGQYQDRPCAVWVGGQPT